MKPFTLFFVKKWWYILAALLLIAVLCSAVIITQRMSQKAHDATITIILSPHFDDAVLSLGGLLSKKEHHAIVATFFTDKPEVSTSTSWDTLSGFKNSDDAENARIKENADALNKMGADIKNYFYTDFQYGRTEASGQLETDIAKDIQALIAAYSDKTVNIYGPAIFTKDITHPDHEALHNAFLDVARQFPQENVHFYVYEDFPYIKRFNTESVVSLQKNLENTSDLFFNKISIPLTASEVREKIAALRKYTSQVQAFSALKFNVIDQAQEYTETRCGSTPPSACEVVYEVMKY